MFDRILNMPLDYLSCFGMVLRGIQEKVDRFQTDFSIHSKLRIFLYSDVIHEVFCSFFHCLDSNVSDNKFHKQKCCVLLFTRIKLVVPVVVCAMGSHASNREDWGLFLRKNHLLRRWGWLSILNCIEALKLSLLLKLPPRKLEHWSVQWSFFLLSLLCISINLLYSHVWNTVVMSGLVLLVDTSNCWISYKKKICRTVGPSLAASLEPLAHHQNVTSLSLFYSYYFGRCSSEPPQLVLLHYSQGRSTRFSDRLHDFSVTIPRYYKDS